MKDFLFKNAVDKIMRLTESFEVYSFFTNIHMLKQTMPVFYFSKAKFEPQATVQKSEIKIFNWVNLSTAL